MLVPNSYRLICECVENGVRRGWARAYKHNDNPSEEQVKDSIDSAVMSEICEWFIFDGEKEA